MRFILFSSIVSVLTACSQGSGGPSTPVNAVFFGDSITQRDPGYAPTIAHDLGWTYVNHAVGGTQMDRTRQEVLAADLTNKSVVIIFVGYNDMRGNGKDAAHLALFKQELTESLQYLSMHGLQIYLGNCFRMYTDYYALPQFAPYDKGSDEAARMYSAVIVEVVNEIKAPNIALVDITNGFLPAPEMYDDKVHPSVQGTAKLVSLFENAITSHR